MSNKPESVHIEPRFLRFDPENPRFFSDANDLTEIEVIRKMLDQEDLLKLVLSIGEKGYYEGEPLLVVPGSEPTHFIVVEGNRRLAALKLLTEATIRTQINSRAVNLAVDEADSRKKPTQIPCLKFEKREDTLEYLGYRHITGARPWGPLAKAKFLKQLDATLPKRLSTAARTRSLAKTIGSNPKTVRDLLVSYNVYKLIEENNFFNIENLDRDTLEFGVFYTALRCGPILEYIGNPTDPKKTREVVNLKHLKDLTEWVYEKVEDTKTGKLVTRLGESRNITRLSRVIQHPQSLKAFQSGVSLKAAAEMTGEQLELFETACSNALDNLKQAAALVSENHERLTHQHARTTSTIELESEGLHERVSKQAKINSKLL